MSIFVGPAELEPTDRIYVGSTEVKAVYVGAVLVWEKYQYYAVAPLTAAEEADWDVAGLGASFARGGGDTYFQAVGGAGGMVITLDLFAFCTPGNNYDISFDVVNIPLGDTIPAGLYSLSASASLTSTLTTPFAASPLGSGDVGTHSLLGQLVDASNRYLKFSFGNTESMQFTNIIVKEA